MVFIQKLQKCSLEVMKSLAKTQLKAVIISLSIPTGGQQQFPSTFGCQGDAKKGGKLKIKGK
jgi:hypothetical protein